MYRFWLCFPQASPKILVGALKSMAKSLLYKVDRVSFQIFLGEGGAEYISRMVPPNNLDLALEMVEGVESFVLEVEGIGMIAMDPSGVIVAPERIMVCVGNYGSERCGEVEVEFKDLELEASKNGGVKGRDWWEWYSTQVYLSNFERMCKIVIEAFVGELVNGRLMQ
ncbi:MAG: hypothetical protein QXR19_04065 [Candidatus Jordarchaeaceae archaeon]